MNGLTVKELKELINNIPKEYDNLPVITTDPDYNEYCCGSGDVPVDTMDIYPTTLGRSKDPAIYVHLIL